MSGAQAFDRAEQARKMLVNGGLRTSTDTGRLKAHPAVAIEWDARMLLMAGLLRKLDLDLVGTGVDASRRPPLRSNSG